MKHDGFYSIEFHTPLGRGNGVVVLTNGEARGGDSVIFYTGSYQLEGDDFVAKIRTGAHCQIPGSFSVFGRNDVNITLSGKFVGTNATLTGTAPEAPGVTLTARLMKIG